MCLYLRYALSRSDRCEADFLGQIRDHPIRKSSHPCRREEARPMTMPSLFVSHGGPNIVLDDTPARD